MKRMIFYYQYHLWLEVEYLWLTEWSGLNPLGHTHSVVVEITPNQPLVGSSAVRAPPVAAAAKMRFDAKIAVISTGYSSHKTSIKTCIYVIHNEVIP